MNRYNSFYQIHKALRAMLYDAALSLQQTDFSNSTETETAIIKVADIVFAFDNHAHHEDSFVNPAVEAYEPELAKKFEDEHVEDHRLSSNLKNLLAICENTLLPEERIICGSAIIKSFVEFMVFNLEHMAKEELLLNCALWEHYTDEQIIEIHHKILAAVPPAEMQQAATWMMRGLNNADIIAWLKDVKQNAPQPVFNNLISIAGNELPAERFAIIENSFSPEEALV